LLCTLEDCGDMTDVAAYASVIASSVSQSTDSEMTSRGLTFRDLETGAFYLQSQLLQVLNVLPTCDSFTVALQIPYIQ